MTARFWIIAACLGLAAGIVDTLIGVESWTWQMMIHDVVAVLSWMFLVRVFMSESEAA